MLTSGGYPGAYKKGLPITGIEHAAQQTDVTVYHAGTDTADGKLVTSGGRVLGVTALGTTYREAIHRAYDAADHIHFSGLQRRSDIAASAVE